MFFEDMVCLCDSIAIKPRMVSLVQKCQYYLLNELVRVFTNLKNASALHLGKNCSGQEKKIPKDSGIFWNGERKKYKKKNLK